MTDGCAGSTHRYIQYTFPTWNAGLDVPHLDLLLYS
jgi:hypothetical protein